MNNPHAFHRCDSPDYVIVSRALSQIGARNPQLAACLCGHFDNVRYSSTAHIRHARESLRQCLQPGRSPGCRKHIEKIRRAHQPAP